MEKETIKEIKRELLKINKYYAFEKATDSTKNLTCVWNKDLIELDFDELIQKIDKLLKED